MATPIPEEVLQRLLVVAARCVEAALTDRPAPPESGGPPLDDVEGGAFVTLRHRGELAGCIGYVDAPPPLDDTVRRAARAAALEDVRFTRLRPEQLQDVDIELSVLSKALPIHPSDLKAGVHGAILRWRGHQGLLLPQVASEYGLDRRGFLAALCEKSSVPHGTEDQDECEILAFTVDHREGRLVDLLAEEEPS